MQVFFNPLPDPLPEEPEVPISYLSNIKDEIEASLSPVFAGQIALVYKLKDHLAIQDEYEDTRQLLLKLKGQENLLAKVADEIDGILLNAPPRRMDSTKTSKISEPTSHPPPATQVSSRGQGVYYIAAIETTGLTGVATVIYNDPSTGVDSYVTQDLNLQEYQNEFSDQK